MRPLSASGTSAKASTSTSPRSVIFSDGITDSARNESVMNGASIVTPCVASRSCNPSSPSATSSSGRSESSPAIGSGSSPRTSPSSATTSPPPSACARAAHSAMSTSDTPTTTRLCASWATVEAKAPPVSPNPRTSPSPTRPVPWWRSITAIFARSRAGSATTCPSTTSGASSKASVISWPGWMPITRTRSGAPAISNETGIGAHRVAQRGGRRRRVLRLAPALEHPRDGERLEVVEQRDVGDVAGGDRPAIEQLVRPRAVQRGHHEHVLGGDALGHRDPAHLVDMPLAVEEVRLAVVGAERAVVRPVLAHQRQQVAQVAGVGGLADQHPHPAPALLQRLRRGERLVVGRDPGRDVRVQRSPRHARGVPVDVRRDDPRQHVRIAGDDPREVHHLGHAQRPRMAQDRAHLVRSQRAARRLEVRRRHARRRHHEDVERQPFGGRRAASRRPRPRRRWRSRAGRRRPRSCRAAPTARANSPGVSFADSRCTWASMKPGHEELPAPVDPLPAVVGADPGDPPVGDRDVPVEPVAGEGGEDLRPFDHHVGLRVPAGDGDQPRHSPTSSSGRTGTRVSARPLAARSAATTAGVEEIVGGSPIPRSP